MCQLTLLDFSPKTFIPRTFVRSLTELNAYGWAGKNDDGFGYMTFSKPGEIVKSNLDSISWWLENEQTYLRSVRNGNGIYHVRLASNNIRDIHSKDAHPFISGDIVLAHNGTLSESEDLEDDKEMQKLFETEDEKMPMIDSEKFTHILANTVGDNKLTANHIDLAMENFTGPFCLLVYDQKQPGYVHVVRGKDRNLFLAEFYDAEDKSSENGKPIGIAINTGVLELKYWSKMIKMAMLQYSKMKLNIRVSKLDEEKVWKYRLGSYKWTESVGEIKQRVPKTRTVIRGHTHTHTNRNTRAVDSDPNYMQVADTALELGFYMTEVFVLSEIIFGQSIHTLDDDAFEVLVDVMAYLKNQNFKGRKKEWENGIREKNLTAITAYKLSGLEFPYMFSSKKDIKRALSRVKERK